MFLYAFGAVVIGGAVMVANKLGKMRENGLRDWAAAHGFSVSNAGALPPVHLKSISLFSRGSSPTYHTVLCSDDHDPESYIFDFSYVVSSGKNSSTYWQTVCAFRVPGWDLPAFSMDPENVLHKIGSYLGYQDIDIEDSPKFSSNYLLRGKDEEAIRGALGIALLDYFGANKNWCMDGAGDWIFLYKRHGILGRMPRSRLHDYYKETQRIFAYFLEGKSP